MFNCSPLGIVRTAPDCTITFAGAVAVFESVQLDDMVQSPVDGIHIVADAVLDNADVPILFVAAIS